ncbi:unnamed protein product, partial [Linum tenue]
RTPLRLVLPSGIRWVDRRRAQPQESQRDWGEIPPPSRTPVFCRLARGVLVCGEIRLEGNIGEIAEKKTAKEKKFTVILSESRFEPSILLRKHNSNSKKFYFF